jgi:hypothetical protein
LLVAAAVIINPLLIAVGSIALALIFGIQLVRAKKILSILENRENLSPSALLNGLLTPPAEEIEAFATKQNLQNAEAKTVLTALKRNHFAAVVGDEIADQTVASLTGGCDTTDLLKIAKQAAYKIVVAKRITIGLVILGGIGSILGAAVSPLFYLLTAIAAIYFILDFFFNITDRIGEHFWEKHSVR